MLSRSSPLETKPIHSNCLYFWVVAPKLFPYPAIADSYVPLLKGWTQLVLFYQSCSWKALYPVLTKPPVPSSPPITIKGWGFQAGRFL
jgi:hypothetical protein